MTDDVEEALARIEQVHTQIAGIRAEIKAEVESRWIFELAALRLLESVYANEARKAGASLSRVGKAMGTTDWRTIKERLALAVEKEEN